MPQHDPRIDRYIEKSAEFARPILSLVRKLVHAACPDVTETLKWSSPFYEHNGILFGTPAFKRHCALIFWKGRLFLKNREKARLRRLTSTSDLPEGKVLRGYIESAVRLNETGVKGSERPKPKSKSALAAPDDFVTALRRNRKALASFEKFSPSHKREYIQWILDAKRDQTRAGRIKTAVQQIGEGKSRHWKYR